MKVYRFEIVESHKTVIDVYSDSLLNATVKANGGPTSKILLKEGVEVISSETMPRQVTLTLITGEDANDV